MATASDYHALRDGVQEGGAPLGDGTFQQLEQRLEQRLLERLEQRIDHRFQRFEERLGEMMDRLDALEVNTPKQRNVDRRPGAEYARGEPVDRPVPARRQLAYGNDSEESDEEPPHFGRRPQHGGQRRGAYEDRDAGECRLKVDIPFFNGCLGIEETLEWVADVEKFFDYMETLPERKVRLVACRLKGTAAVWWERVQFLREREGKGPVRTWYRMKHLLMNEFLPPDYDQILFEQYQSCQQGSRSVHEYTGEFMRLEKRNHLMESEGQLIARYLKGLRPAVRDRMGVHVIRTLTEAKNLALKAESLMLERSRRNAEGFRSSEGFRNSAGSEGRSRVVAESSTRGGGSNRGMPEDKTIGKRPMTEGRDKEVKKPENPYARPSVGKCFKCNQPGHRSNECPLRRTVNIVDFEEDDEEHNIYCEADEEVEYEEDEGQIFVIRRMMLAPK